MAKQAKRRRSDNGGADRSSNPLPLLGGVLWIVAWFVPVARGQELFGSVFAFASKAGTSPQTLTADLGGPDWLPGWMACKFAWNVLVAGNRDPGGGAWRQYLVGSSCLVNGVMVLVLVAAMFGVRNRAQGVAMLLGAGVAASWAYLLDRNPFDVWAAGYWLWLGSFVIVGVGLLVPPRAA